MVFLGAPPAPGPARFTPYQGHQKRHVSMGKIWGKYGENMGKMMRNPNLMVIFATGIHDHSWGYGWRE
jgi:hypothetical protein